ncbi:MAG TPA: hypothetical protein VGQ66_02095 [Candidatus Limnocylindria bacterium]|jgi:hypothetical protein|nr:hypothetical protein [Candidatus Limnocylindria bacterium]
MRIYEGSPRQGWEEVFRSIGAYVDRERIKELLLLELDAGFILQGMAMPQAGARTESEMTLIKVTRELPDDEVAELMEGAPAKRGTATSDTPHADISNYYEQAMRVIGAYLDLNKPRDVFLFEQDGAFVLRLLMLGAGAAPAGHQLVEFTRDDIVAMIDAAPTQRQPAAEAGPPDGETVA